MDPKRSRAADESAPEPEPIPQAAEQPRGEKRPEPPIEAVTRPASAENAATDDEVTEAGALDPADLFGSVDVGVQATPDAVPGASVAHRSPEADADNVPTGVDSFASDFALSPPAIEEIAASLRSPPVADAPAAILARDMVATWQDLPAESDSNHDDPTADRRESANDGVPKADSRSAPASVDVGGFMAPESVEPQSVPDHEFGAFDWARDAQPTDERGVHNFLGRHDDPIVIERGPIRTDDDSWRPSITLLGQTSSDSDIPERPSNADLSPRATRLQSPTSDGGPPLARPILMASIPDEQTRRILDEALAEVGRRDAKTAAEIAQQQVEDAFWLRACEERAVYRGR